ncbi:MAG TPA: serine/threonine-protein kinase [Polyangiaceae bacterium]
MPPGTPDTAYRDTDEGRALLQSRLARLARVSFILCVVFYPIGLVARGAGGITGVSGFEGAFGPEGTWHLVGTLLFLVAWLAARNGVLSLAALLVTDFVMTVGVSFSFAMMGRYAPAWARPEQFMAFVVGQLLVIRAALLPCPTVHSVAVSACALAPIPLLAYRMYAERPLAGSPGPLPIAVNAAVLALIVVAVVGIISYTVHGLRERVREALRLGQYTLTEKIGEGGMGVVYKASHALLRRPTAIKLLPPERAGEHNIARFEREVQLTSLLTHANTVSIYDFGRTPEGTFYYAMEYLDGIDLQTLSDGDGAQEPGRVIHLLSQMVGALAEAHRVGLIHRDVKPANVILCERGGTPDVVKVLDFGLVKEMGAPADPKVSTTGSQQIIGTPLYLSPEAIGAPATMDGRSDLYAVGAVGYLLLTGTPPFTGQSVMEVCSHHMLTPPTPPSERLGRPVPADLEAVILKCLAKSPSERPRDAAALEALLAACESSKTWTNERAAAWWREKGMGLRSLRPSVPVSTGTSRALRVTREMRV